MYIIERKGIKDISLLENIVKYVSSNKMRELRNLESISYNYVKTILTLDKTINKDYNGIKVINIIDFLLEDY